MSTVYTTNFVRLNNSSKNAWNYADEIFYEVRTAGYRKVAIAKIKKFVEVAFECVDRKGLINICPDETMPSDAYAEIVYRTTYSVIALAIYLKLKMGTRVPTWLEAKLPKVMDAAFTNGVIAHGEDSMFEVIDIMKMLIIAGAPKFINAYSNVSSTFNKQMTSIMVYYKRTVAKAGDNPNKWNTGVKAMNSVLAAWNGFEHTVFVYGTLMKGERASSILTKSIYGGTAILEGYEIYNLGQFPGIQNKENRRVYGEIYFVNERTLNSIDFYENEGITFDRREVVLSGGVRAETYVYCDGPCNNELNRLWNGNDNKRVWYAAYGSNLDSCRFACYINGGHCNENGITYTGCKDKNTWHDDYFDIFPGDLYFGNQSKNWNYRGVAFLDVNAKHKVPVAMHLYNISYGQLLDIQKQEGKSPNWYGKMVVLGISKIDGAPIITLTSDNRQAENSPSPRYMQLMRRALFEAGCFPNKEIEAYLKRIGTSGMLDLVHRKKVS